MGWIVLGILVVILLLFAFAFGCMIKTSMKYFWYEYYEDDADYFEENSKN